MMESLSIQEHDEEYANYLQRIGEGYEEKENEVEVKKEKAKEKEKEKGGARKDSNS